MKAVVNREVHRHPSLYPLLHPPPRSPPRPRLFPPSLFCARGALFFRLFSISLIAPDNNATASLKTGAVVGRIAMTFQICLLEDKIRAAKIKRSTACNFRLLDRRFILYAKCTSSPPPLIWFYIHMSNKLRIFFCRNNILLLCLK